MAEMRQAATRGESLPWKETGLVAESMKAGKEMLKGTGRFKWADAPGDGKVRAVFVCNAHVDCTHQRRVVLLSDSYYHIQEVNGHSEEPQKYARKNAPLTVAQEEKMEEDVWKGTKPAVARAFFTLKRENELKAAGIEPESYKKVQGGLDGAQKLQIALTVRIPCVPYVSLYSVGILLYFTVFRCIASYSPRRDVFWCIMYVFSTIDAVFMNNRCADHRADAEKERAAQEEADGRRHGD